MKQLLQTSNCCVEVVTLNLCEELSQNKIVLKKWQHMREGKSLFERNEKPYQTSDYV